MNVYVNTHYVKGIATGCLASVIFLTVLFGGLPEKDRIFQLSQSTQPNPVSAQKLGFKTKIDEILFVLRMPVSWDPQLAKQAKLKKQNIIRGLLVLTTAHVEIEDLVCDVSSDGTFPQYIRFADANNLAVMTWSNFRGYQNRKNADEYTEEQNRKFDEVFNSRLAEWERGFKRTLNYYNLPDKNIMAYGISGGAQMMHRIVMRRPDYFAGVHVHVNSSYDTPTGEGTKVLWLVTTGECEYGYPAAQRFYQAMVEKGYRVIFRAEPNLPHRDSPDTSRLSLEFFKYLLTFVPDSADPNWAPPPVDKFYMMQYPIYVGDYLNLLVYPLDKAQKNIDSKYMVPLPTRPIAQAWGTIVKQ